MNDIEFKEHLRKECLSYGISQRRLAYLSGITRHKYDFIIDQFAGTFMDSTKIYLTAEEFDLLYF